MSPENGNSTLVYICIAMVLICIAVSALVARFVSIPPQENCYVFDLKKAVRIYRNAPDFEYKIRLIEKILNYYQEPVFLKGVVVNGSCADITDQVLTEVQRAGRSPEEN